MSTSGGAHLEIERRFLAASLSEGAGELIEQGYLVVAEDGAEVRVRSRAGEYSLTVKRGRGLARSEAEVAITAEQFANLWPLTEGRRLKKTRRIVVHGGFDVEVDVYGGALSGLVVAEIEFTSEREAEAFAPPPWCEIEITHDPRFRNQAIVPLTGAELAELLRSVRAQSGSAGGGPLA